MNSKSNTNSRGILDKEKMPLQFGRDSEFSLFEFQIPSLPHIGMLQLRSHENATCQGSASVGPTIFFVTNPSDDRLHSNADAIYNIREAQVP